MPPQTRRTWSTWRIRSTAYSRMASPDLVFFIAGADPHQGDRLGRLALTFDGLRRRDAIVLGACRARGLPVCIVTGGGYGARLEDTVEVRLNTIRVATTFAHQTRLLLQDLNARAELQSAQPGLTRFG